MPEREQDKDWISVEDIADELGLHPDTVRGWIRNKTLPAFKFGHVYRSSGLITEEFVRSRSTRDMADGNDKIKE